MTVLKFELKNKDKSKIIARRKAILANYIKQFFYDLAVTDGEVNLPYFVEAQREIDTKLNTDEKVNYWFRKLKKAKVI